MLVRFAPRPPRNATITRGHPLSVQTDAVVSGLEKLEPHQVGASQGQESEG